MPIAAKDLMAEVRKLASEYPDCIVNACLYIDAESSQYPDINGCIIGVALRRLGVTEEMCHEAHEFTCSSIQMAEVRSHFGVLDASQVEVAWLYKVQRHQDLKNKWSEAITVADDHIQDCYNVSPPISTPTEEA